MKASGRMSSKGNHSSMGGSKSVISAVKRISAPTPPKNASMSGMGNKLRKGDAK